MRVTEHIDPETIYDHLEERLETARAGAVEAHLWRCERCRELRDECAAVLEGLDWYGSRETAPPDGYWDAFWDRWSPDRDAARPDPRVIPIRRLPTPLRSLATAAVIALIVLGWWTATRPGAPTPTPALVDSTAAPAATSGEWGDDLEMFERAAIAVGSVDPMSKGIVLAGLVEER